VISQKEVDRYIKLTNNFIKQLRRIRSTKQRKAIAVSAAADIIIAVSANALEAVGLIEFGKRQLMLLLEDEYRLKTRVARPSEAVV